MQTARIDTFARDNLLLAHLQSSSSLTSPRCSSGNTCGLVLFPLPVGASTMQPQKAGPQ